jgi:hypothetical protein
VKWVQPSEHTSSAGIVVLPFALDACPSPLGGNGGNGEMPAWSPASSAHLWAGSLTVEVPERALRAARTSRSRQPRIRGAVQRVFDVARAKTPLR